MLGWALSHSWSVHRQEIIPHSIWEKLNKFVLKKISVAFTALLGYVHSITGAQKQCNAGEVKVGGSLQPDWIAGQSMSTGTGYKRERALVSACRLVRRDAPPVSYCFCPFEPWFKFVCLLMLPLYVCAICMLDNSVIGYFGHADKTLFAVWCLTLPAW